MASLLRKYLATLFPPQPEWGAEEAGPVVELTEDLVRATLASFGKYVVEKNMAGLHTLISIDVRATEVNLAQGVRREATMDRAFFLSRIASSMVYTATYHRYDIQPREVTIHDRNRASADCEVSFVYSVEENQQSVVCREQFVIEIRNGHPRITEFRLESV